jgi:ABC transporter substrate binding protein
MKRREFIALLGSAAAWPVAARAQDGRTYRIGVLNANPRGSPMMIALFDELRRNGLVEGRNMVVEGSGIGIPYPRFPDVARELAKAKVEALVVGGGSPPIRSVHAVAPDIPIIGVADDMVAAGLAQSLVQPGGNVSGVSLFAPELDGKRQELLIEVLPGVRRMAALADPRVQPPQQLQALQEAARTRGVELSIHPLTSADAIVPANQRCESGGRGRTKFAGGVVVWQQSQSDHRAHQGTAPACHLSVAQLCRVRRSHRLRPAAARGLSSSGENGRQGAARRQACRPASRTTHYV